MSSRGAQRIVGLLEEEGRLRIKPGQSHKTQYERVETIIDRETGHGEAVELIKIYAESEDCYCHIVKGGKCVHCRANDWLAKYGGEK